MTLRRLRWIALLALLAAIVVIEAVRQALYPYLAAWNGRLLLDGAIFILGLALLAGLFQVIERQQERALRQHREVAALHAAALDIWDALTLETTLQRVVDQARMLVEARYGALSVVGDQNRIESFLTSGITAEERARIGPLPVGHGLLGVVLHHGHPLRLPDLRRDPRSVGFPPHHPEMRSLVAVPILCKSPFRGNLYLTEKQGGGEFSADDEASLTRFATTAAIAIDNAFIHRQLKGLAISEERLRIAHEMHDGLAQVLAYVNTKAQAVREFLRTGRAEEASRQLEQLAAAAREVYADLRESIMGLRTGVGEGRTMSQALAEYAAAWESQTGIGCRLSVDESLHLAPGVELQLLRIVHEALANVRKHAQAQRTDVEIKKSGETVVVTVADDGIGFNPSEIGRPGFPRFGLTTMRERAESVGGVVRWDSAPRAGTRVTVEIPLQNPPQPLHGSA
jgi:signal transduction histidine kinase